MTSATRTYYKEYRTMYERLTRLFRPRVERALRAQVKYFTAAYAEHQFVTPDVIPAKMLEKSILEIHITGGLNGARMAHKSVKKQVKATSDQQARWTYVINEYLRQNGLDKLTIEITNTLRKQIIKVLQEANEKGWGVDETVRYLNTAAFPKWMATRIVRTEMAKAANTGAMVGATDAGIELEKQWISATDNRTRYIPRDKYDHLHMDGKIVGFNEEFVIPSTQNVEGLMYPCDPKGSAGNVINCRCCVAFVPVRDGEGNPVAMQNSPANPFIRLLEQAKVLGRAITDFVGNIFKEYHEIEVK